MYKLHLILKYLRKRRIAWVSLIAVTLCSAMVLIVLSVMGGWLRMFLDTSRALSGDEVIYEPSVTGFPHYQEILDAVRKLPEVKGAVPVISSYGVANIFNPVVSARYQSPVTVKAFGDLDQVGKVNSFYRSLYREYQLPMQSIDKDSSLSSEEKARRKALIADGAPNFDKPLDADTYRQDLPGKAGFDSSTLGGIIVSTPIILDRNDTGHYDREQYIYETYVTLTVGDLTSLGSSSPDINKITFWLSDDCHTGFWPVDNTTVYIPFERLQKLLGMDARSFQEKVGDQWVSRQQPARVSEIQVSLHDGVDVYAARDKLQTLVGSMSDQFPDLNMLDRPLKVESWDERQADFIGAVEHEKELLTFLFAIISLVAVFMIFCIFYMIVVEKTRDIGIIKSVGASNWGVAQIFLGYGMAIGIVGSAWGLFLAYLVVHNINYLNDLIGKFTGEKPFNGKTYIFDTLPNTIQISDAIWIVSIAILAAELGALLPAIRAARLSPVQALGSE